MEFSKMVVEWKIISFPSLWYLSTPFSFVDDTIAWSHLPLSRSHHHIASIGRSLSINAPPPRDHAFVFEMHKGQSPLLLECYLTARVQSLIPPIWTMSGTLSTKVCPSQPIVVEVRCATMIAMILSTTQVVALKGHSMPLRLGPCSSYISYFHIGWICIEFG
jgi:hypothetical protein